MNILVVDDEPLICEIIKVYLENLGSVKSAPSAIEALEVLKNEEFNLIISDFYMPEMTGLELVQKLRHENNQVPVLLMSGSHVDENELLNFTDFIKKPTNPKELMEKVKKIT